MEDDSRSKGFQGSLMSFDKVRTLNALLLLNLSLSLSLSMSMLSFSLISSRGFSTLSSRDCRRWCCGEYFQMEMFGVATWPLAIGFLEIAEIRESQKKKKIRESQFKITRIDFDPLDLSD